MDHKAFLKTLSADDRDRLTVRSDLAGLRHLALHFGLIFALGSLIAARIPGWWLLLLPQGVLLAFLFTLEHEATHKTPFASERLNEWVGWLCGLLIVQPFLWFRYFHFAHHRYTNDPDNDPELTVAPKPHDWPSFLRYAASFTYWKKKAALLWNNAFGTIDEPYLPARIHADLRTEARLMLVIYAVVLGVTLLISTVFLWTWLVPLVVGFPLLRIYLLAEHGLCPNVPNMFDNTRTTFTNGFVRLLAWNMPYHIEHHVFPQVPFYLLPAFHRETDRFLRHTSHGYGAFTRDYVAAFRR